MNIFFIVCVAYLKWFVPVIVIAALLESTKIGNRLMSYLYAIVEYINR